MLKFLRNFFGSNPIKTIADTVDRFVETKEEKKQFFMELYKLDAEDRNQARALYGRDSIMQKIYAATFLLGYLGLTAWLIYAIITKSIQDINQFETGMIGTIWGAMSAKVNTVTDFFFGSSDDKRDQNRNPLVK